MKFYLFNCRPLKLTPSNIANTSGSLAIFTAFHPDRYVCCDIIIFFPADEKIDIQCTMTEETPQLLDPELDTDTLEMFNLLIKENKFQMVNLTENVARDIITNALPIESQLVTH